MGAPLTTPAPLFVRGNRPDRFEKAANAGADAIIIDLQDAVPADAKDMARSALRSDFTMQPVFARVNGLGTRYHEADMAALRGHNFAAVVVPRTEFISSFVGLCAASPFPIVALVETARGISDARELGFGEKPCIHPRQIQPIRVGFVPEDSDIRWAKKVLASGDGATTVERAMVDESVRTRAGSILKQAGIASIA